MIWLFQFAKTGRIKTMKEAIKTFFQYNGRMPSSKEIKNMEGVMREAQGKTADVIQFPKDRITPFHIPRPGEASPLLKDSPEAIAKIKAENKAAVKRLQDKKKDRVATADELEDYINELDPTGETGVVEEGMTIRQLDKMVAEQKAYEAKMYQQYKMGKLDPVAGDKSPARKRFLEKKLEEMELSGHKRLMTRDEIEELESFNLNIEDMKTPPEDPASGGIAGQLHLYDGGRVNYDKGGMSRRKFLQLFGGLASVPLLGKFFKAAKPISKAAAPAVEKIATVAGGIPEYASRLIEVVKNKGIMEIMEGLYKRNPPQKKYTYKGVEVTEDGLGTTSVRKEQTKTGSWTDQASDKTIVDDYVDREIGFEIRKGETVTNKKGKQIQTADEYTESTAKMQGDPEGGMDVSEVLEYIDDADHLELKKIADESLIKKAEGGRVSLCKGGLADVLGV